MTERIPVDTAEITEPEASESNVLDDDELEAVGADAEDAEPVEDDPTAPVTEVPEP